MKVVVLDCGRYRLGPDQFTAEEVALARSKGVLIQENYSKTVGHSYLSNTCLHCQLLTGNHFLFEHYEDAMYGHSKFERLPLGYFVRLVININRQGPAKLAQSSF